MNDREWKREQRDYYKRVDAFMGNIFAGIIGGFFVTLFIEISSQEINWKLLYYLSLFIFVIFFVCFLYFFPYHAWIQFKIEMGKEYNAKVKDMKKMSKKHKKVALLLIAVPSFMLIIASLVLKFTKTVFTSGWGFLLFLGILYLLIYLWFKFFLFRSYGNTIKELVKTIRKKLRK